MREGERLDWTDMFDVSVVHWGEAGPDREDGVRGGVPAAGEEDGPDEELHGEDQEQHGSRHHSQPK